jgi:hypothetical protein
MSPLPCSDLIASELPFTKQKGIPYLYPATPHKAILFSLCDLGDTLNNARFSSGNKSVEAQTGVRQHLCPCDLWMGNRKK